MAVSKLVGTRLQFLCPACDETHEVVVSQEGVTTPWVWNGSLLQPTITPSIRVTRREWLSEESYNTHVCHSFVTEGLIHYLDDCTHPKRGKILGLPTIGPDPEPNR